MFVFQIFWEMQDICGLLSKHPDVTMDCSFLNLLMDVWNVQSVMTGIFINYCILRKIG